jgi:Rv2632c-like
MSMNDRWSVGLDIIEIDGQTHAEARLAMVGKDELVGRGEARRHPADEEVTLIGEQIAAARALSDLAGKLLYAAATGIEDMTHERAHLHM